MTISETPAPTATLLGSRGLASCGMNSRARTIGPATRCGKKLRYRPKSIVLAGSMQAPVHVDDVGDRLEDDEADADRQRDRGERQRQAEPDLVEDGVDLLGEEPVVLEDAERAEVDARPRPRRSALAPALVLGAVDELRRALVGERQAAEQHAEHRVRRAVEDVGRREDEP